MIFLISAGKCGLLLHFVRIGLSRCSLWWVYPQITWVPWVISRVVPGTGLTKFERLAETQRQATHHLKQCPHTQTLSVCKVIVTFAMSRTVG